MVLMASQILGACLPLAYPEAPVAVALLDVHRVVRLKSERLMQGCAKVSNSSGANGPVGAGCVSGHVPAESVPSYGAEKGRY